MSIKSSINSSINSFKNTEQTENYDWFSWAIKYIREIFLDAIIIIWIVVFVRYFLISPFEVNWSSMKSTFHDWDYILVEKLSYRFSEPKFWDVVIFTPPVPRIHQLSWMRCLIEHLNTLSFDSKVCQYADKYIKRVIWLPWDIISFKDWAVYRNWEMLDESEYLNKTNNWKTYLPSYQSQTEFKVPEKHIFTLWDNRNWSSDSRFWKTEKWENKPFVPYNELTWRFILKLFAPSYFFWEREQPFLILK